MYCFKSILCTCVLALLFSTSLSAQGKDQLFELQRFHVVPGQEQTLIDEFTKLSNVYTKDVNYSWMFFQYDDHTFEVAIPIDNLGEMDRSEAAFAYSLATQEKASGKSLIDEELLGRIIVGKENQVVRKHAKLSYKPEGMKMDDLNYNEIVTYRIKPGKQQELYELAEAYPAITAEMRSPLPYSFWTYDYGGEMNTFEIVFLARNAAHLAEMRAAHAKAESDAANAWEAKVEPLIEEVRTITGHYVEVLSKDKKPEPSNLYAVNIQRIAIDKIPEATAVYAELKALLRDGETNLYWSSDLMEDGRLYQHLPIKYMSGLDEVMEQIAKRSYQLNQDKLQPLYKRFAAFDKGSELAVVYHHTDLSYPGKGEDAPTAYSHFSQIEYTFEEKDRAAVMELAAEYRRMSENYGAKVPFNLFTWEFGGPSNELIVRIYGKTKDAIKADSDADDKLMPAAELQTWQAKVEKLLKITKTTYGRNAPELAYQAEALK